MLVNIRKGLKKILPDLRKAREDDLSEANTVQLIIKFFADVLGYAPIDEITLENPIKNNYVDMALRIDGVIRVLVEAKGSAMKLRERFIEKAKHYAADANIRWVVLTNGLDWNLYHYQGSDEGNDYDEAFSIDLENSEKLEIAADQLAVLHRQSVSKGGLEDYWRQRVALSPKSISGALLTDCVLRVLRREIRKTEKILIDEEDLANAIHDMFSVETREQVGPVKIKHARSKHKAQTARTENIEPDAAAAPGRGVGGLSWTVMRPHNGNRRWPEFYAEA